MEASFNCSVQAFRTTVSPVTKSSAEPPLCLVRVLAPSCERCWSLGLQMCSRSNRLDHAVCSIKLFRFLSGSANIEVRQASRGLLVASWDLLGASWRLLGASWRLLGPSWSVLGACWCPLGNHVGCLQTLKAKVIFFPWLYEALAGHLPCGNRQQLSELDSWSS